MKQNLIGKKFDQWTVLSRGRGQRYWCRTRQLFFIYPKWKCSCSCGKIKTVMQGNLLSGKSKGCGCLRNERLSKARAGKYLGDLSPNWKGGKFKNLAGYIVLSSGPHATRREHQVIMEEILARPLFPGETVHHKNGVRDDNRPENLELWASRHPPGQRIKDLQEWAIKILTRYPVAA